MDNYYGAMDSTTLMIYGIVAGIIGIIMIIAGWRIFQKAGKPGWASIIPIYNIIVFLQIVKKPLWWFILLLIPLVNIVIAIMLCASFVKVFGKPGWHVLLLLFFGYIYIPVLAFGKAQYKADGATA